MTTPPSGLFEALRHDADKQDYVDWVFSRVADRYDLGNDLMSAGWHTRWKRRLVSFARIEPEHRVLDIAAGTGDVTYMIGREAFRGEVIGSDINPDMLAVAEKKRPAGCENVRFSVDDAAALPYDDDSFDRVTCVYAGRGFPDFPAVLREVHRVLKPGGEFWNLDFARQPNKAWDKVVRGYMMASGAALGVALHGHPKTYMYIPASMAAYPGQRWLDREMKAAGFDTWLVETFGCLMAYNLGVKRQGT
ncbi:MAG: ubiquinone/menaquinone biosynthesis methyltransferase [Alphaproteobacteria bacterium]|nr:ubiquinone/menaquinone biosynthesis methyltransferase [Alphaproteobacteria bacterium]